MGNTSIVLSTEEFLGTGNKTDTLPASTGIMSTEEFLGKPLQSGTVSQVAGEVPTKEYFKNLGRGALKGATLRNLTPEEQQTPGMQLGEFAGSAVPMIASEALVPASPLLTPMVRAGLSGMVFGAAKGAVNQTPLSQQVSDIPKSGLAFMGGQKLGEFAGKVLTPFSGTPATEAGRLAAESVGIKPPLGTMTDSKFVQVLERGLEFTPFGIAITRQRQKALADFTTYAQGIGEKIAVSRPPEVAGNLAKEQLVNLFQANHEATTKMYDAVMPLIRQANPPVELGNTIGALENIISNRSGDLEPPMLNKLRTMLNGLKKVEPNLATFEGGKDSSVKVFDQLKKDRTNLGLMTTWNNPAVAGIQKDLHGLYGAMSEDMNQTVKKVSENAFNDLAKASESNVNAQQIIKSKLFNAILSVKPENVYKLVIMPNSPSQVELGKEVLGDSFHDVSRQWFDDILRQSTKDGIVSPVLLKNKLEKYASVIPSIAEGNPELLSHLNKIHQVASLLSRGREVSQGSVTAFAGAGMTSLGAMIAEIVALFKNPMVAGEIAGGVAATGLGVKGITSNVGRELLTRGFPRAGQAVTKVATPISKLGLQKLGDNQ